MKFVELTEWKNFEAALIHELKATPLAEFESIWIKSQKRTQFYKTKLLPKVATNLGYEFKAEFLLVDYSILNKDRVPVIFIESEHSAESAVHETDKLCAVSSPVKVLFLCCPWTDEVRNQFLPRWKERITTHHKYVDQKAVYMIVVGEWGRGKPKHDGILRYYIESFDIFGKQIIDPKELVLSTPK
jgi:hypothetical protein